MNASTCPYCGAETRPGDNFCLNCGNRLLPATPSSQQAQPVMGGDSTIPAQEGWAQTFQGSNSAPSSSGATWSADPSSMTLASNDEEPPTIRGDAPTVMPSSTAQATMERSARFVLRAENGDVLAEYPLEKPEISIGRAPNSDILLSKDKLTSRRHATVRNDNGSYVLYDERSANGTFVNGQQLEEMTPRVLQDGDHIGIGEHELVFHGPGSTTSHENEDLADLPTIAAPYNPSDMTYRTREDELVTSATSDDFSTRSMENGATASPVPQMDEIPSTPPVVSAPSTPSASPETGATPMPSSNEPTISMPSNYAPASESAATSTPSANAPANGQPSPSSSPSSLVSSTALTFNRLTTVPQPSVPDIAPLLAALSSLDGQVMSLQEQLKATQEAVHNHDAEVAQVASQLRVAIRRVSERMDNTIADVARSREALAWTDLLQLMDDVQNNPRDIEYVSKLGRKARELNKVFQIHQSVLNTLAECNSLLRGLIGEEK
jgi:predicted component of type VI protein secretion system